MEQDLEDPTLCSPRKTDIPINNSMPQGTVAYGKPNHFVQISPKNNNKAAATCNRSNHITDGVTTGVFGKDNSVTCVRRKR